MALSKEASEHPKRFEMRLERSSGRRRGRSRSRREWPLSRRVRRHLRRLDGRELWFRTRVYVMRGVLLAALTVSAIYHRWGT